MYFILETIIFIARLFPDRQPEAIRQQQSEQEKKADDANTNYLGSAKSTPKPRRDQITKAKVIIGSHDSSESAQVSLHSDASLEKSVFDRSTLINAHGSSPRSAQRSVHLQRSTRPPRLSHRPPHRHATHEPQQNSTLTRDTHHQPDHRRNGAVGSLSRTNVEQAMVDMVVQAGGANVSKTHPRKILTLKDGEARTQEDTSDTYIYNSPSGIPSSETTLVNTPTEALSPLMLQQECGEEACASSEQKRSDEAGPRSTRPLLEPHNGGNDGPLEEAGNVPQGVREQVVTAEMGSMVQEVLLRTEEAAHQETRNELARLEAWCEGVHDEDTALQTQLQNADCEIKRIRKQLGDAEDEDTKLQTQLSAAESRIRGFENSLPELHRKVVERDSSLHQLGMDFYSRLQDAGRLISPHDRVWAEYKDLMNAAAQHLSTSPNARDEQINSHDNVSRFEELGEVEDSDGRERSQNEYRAPTLDTNMVMGDNTLTKEGDAIQAEGNGTASDDGDDDDEISRRDHPTRPGTASRLSISFFTAQSEEQPAQASFSHLEGPQETQEARESVVPTPSSSHPYPEVSVDLEEKCEASNGFNVDFGSNHSILSKIYTAVEAELSHATDEVEGVEESTPLPEASQRIFSTPFEIAVETSGVKASGRKSNRKDGRGRQHSSKNKSRPSSMSELAYNPAVFDTSWPSQLEKFLRSSSPGVTDNEDSEPSEVEKEPGSQILGAGDANVDATAAVIDPSLEAQYNMLTQSTNTVTGLRKARNGKAMMTGSEPRNPPPENTPRATWAPFPPVTKKSPLDLMNELPLNWMLPTPPTIRPSDVQGRNGESSRSQHPSAVQDGTHVANMKAWIASVAPLEQRVDAVKKLNIQPPRVTRKAQDAKNAKGQTLNAKPSSESQTGEAASVADGQTQDTKPSSGIQTRRGTQAAHMDPLPFEEGLWSLINGIRNLSLGPSIDAASKMEKESKAQLPGNSNVNGQGRHTENLGNLINGMRDLSLGPSVDPDGRSDEESRIRLSGDWNVSGRGQYGPKDLDKGPIFGRFLERKTKVANPGFTAKQQRLAIPKIIITKASDDKSRSTQSEVMASKVRMTGQKDAAGQEEHETASPIPISDQQRNANEPRTTAQQDGGTDQPAVTTSATENTAQNAAHQPPPQTEAAYISVYSLQGASYADAAPKKNIEILSGFGRTRNE